jgi:RHS repeat-associated protein
LANGAQRYYTYDSTAHLTSQQGAWGAGLLSYTYLSNAVTRVTDAVGAISEVTVNDQRLPIGVRQRNGGLRFNQFDTAKNPIQTVNALGNTNQFGYDTFSNRTSVTDAEGAITMVAYEPRFQQVSLVTDALGHTNAFEYDTNGNLIAGIAGDGSSQSFSYDAQGNRTSATDAAGNMSSFAYNSFGVPTAVTNALGFTSQFAYNVAGDLVAFTNASGNAVALTRDALGRLTSRIYADGSHEDIEYSSGGRVSATTNRRGQRITYAYDPNGRPEWKTYASGKQRHFRYDPRGLFAGVKEINGGITKLQVEYDRDLVRQLSFIKVPRSAPNQTFDVSLAHDAAGRKTLMAYPDGYIVYYHYDRANRLVRISAASTNLVVAYQYDAAGRRTQRTLGNGTYTTYGYDLANRLLGMTNFAPSGAIQSSFNYTYNAAGMRSSITTLEGVRTNEYDHISQLKRVTYADSSFVQYCFDAAGNRTNVTTKTETDDYIVNALDQYEEAGADTLSYDEDGNLTWRISPTATAIYSWDEDNHLKQAACNGRSVLYRYDYQGHLIQKSGNGATNCYIWDSRNLVADVNVADGMLKRFVYGAGMDEVVLISEQGTNYWIQQDGLGSTVGVTDDEANLLFNCSYDAYGNVRSGGIGTCSRGFAGMLWDSDAKLYYARARWYSTIEGRFIQPDPARFEGGANLYSYVANNPVNHIDPVGLFYVEFNFDLGPVGASVSLGPGGWSVGGWAGESVGYGGGIFVYGGNPSSGLGAGGSVFGAYGLGAEISQNVGGTADVGIGLGYGGGVSVGANFGGTWGGGNKGGDQSGGDEGGGDEGGGDQGGGDQGGDDWGGDDWGGGDWGGGDDGGGTCPTFIQLPLDQAPTARQVQDSIAREAVVAKIMVPMNRCLLRSDIPIYGIAGGAEFSKYRLEYGEGCAPTKWHMINSSTSAETNCSVTMADIPLMQGDVDLRGNLGTWNTGLKNWTHLPWHAPEDATDVNGVYTIRLVVEGKSGKTIEDRVTCEVGRAIAQCLPGTAISPDQRVVMRFAEQALMHPFRVYTILPASVVGEKVAEAPSGCKFASEVYRIREPGDRFIKDVQLEFACDAKSIAELDAKHVGLCSYDEKSKSWIWLKTSRDNSGVKFQTALGELPTPKAIYALVYDPRAERSSLAEPPAVAGEPLSPVQSGVLINETFEKDFGTFKSRDRWVGARLSRDNKATPNGTYCLKVRKENQGGNFSLTVLDRPFNVEEYPILSFDYSITADVKTDFLLKVGDRWYNLRFTDDPVNYRNRDVNIANLGAIEGVLPDGGWHKATVDLRKLLKQQTRNIRVDEIIMADWVVTGYMKLEFGNNARGATYYLDNFRMSAGPATALDDIAVNDFERTDKINLLKGPSGAFSNPGTDYCQTGLVEETAGTNHNRCLKLTYDTSSTHTRKLRYVMSP